MSIKMMNFGVLVLFFLMVACSAPGESVEPAAVDVSAATEEFSTDYRPLERIPAVPLGEKGEIINSGESEVLVEFPNGEGQKIGLLDGEALDEKLFEGDDVAANDVEMKSIDIDSRDGQIAYAGRQLAQRLDVDLEDVSLVLYESKVWPDRSMGCRSKGFRLGPMEVHGYVIYFQVEEEIYAFHGGEGRLPFQCSQEPVDAPIGRLVIDPPVID